MPAILFDVGSGHVSPEFIRPDCKLSGKDIRKAGNGFDLCLHKVNVML